MKEELGTVISTFEGPSTNKFSFVLNSNAVRKGQFIQVDTEDGLLIGNVSDITRANRYFERAESVAEYERNGASIIQNFPTTDWEYTIANCRALGVYKDSVLIRSTFPPSPGSKVVAADESLLVEFLGLEGKGLKIGSLQSHSVTAGINMNRLLQKHFAILAMSGAGKSYSASVILEELLSRAPEQGRPAIIVLDVHGEYLGFAEGAGGFRSQTRIIDGKKIRIGLPGVSPYMLAHLLPELSGPQKRELTRLMNELRYQKKKAHEPYDLADLLQHVEDSDLKDNTKGTLLSWLDQLKQQRLFAKSTYPTRSDLAQPGKLAILDLSEIDSQRKKVMIAYYFAEKLFSARKKGKIPPFLLLVEESHNFAPEKVSRKDALAKGVIERIAREGRKFGASLALITQRPVRLSTTALSQCNTHMIMRVTNPYDIKHIGESCEGVDQSMLQSITTLRTGEALLIGEAVNYPVFLKVRKRRSHKSSKGESIEQLARKFEEAKAKREQDVEAFL